MASDGSPKRSEAEYFAIRHYGDMAIITPAAEVEALPSNLIQAAAELVLVPLKDRPPSSLIVDLSKVPFFGSEFISFLLRCHLIVKQKGTELALAGVNERIRELLQQTNLDTIWPIYDTREEAMSALGVY